MATPGNFPLEVYQGDTAEFTLSFTRKNADGTTEPVDFTGAVGLSQIRRAPRDPSKLAEFEVTFPDAIGGVVKMVLPANQSGLLGVQTGVYDLQITDVDGRVRTWLAGTVTVTPGVSR